MPPGLTGLGPQVTGGCAARKETSMSEIRLRSTPGLRTAAVCLVVAFAALFVSNVFVTSPASVEAAERYFSRSEIERSLQYSRERKLLIWCGIGMKLALLTALVSTGWGRRLADFFDRLSGRRWFVTLVLMGACFLVINDLLMLPVNLLRLEQDRTWNLTERSVNAWLIDHVKSLAVTAVQSAIVILGLYGLMWFFPRRWWLVAATGGTVLGVAYAWLMPIVITPLFNEFTPLGDPYLNQRVQVLAEKAQLPVDEVLVMDAFRRGRHTNAYFIGFGCTRRVVLYDTLLKSHSGMHAETAASAVGLLASGPAGGPWLAASQTVAARQQGADEIESILGHEMGHWRHHHIVKGLVLASGGGFLALFVLARILRWAVGRRPFGMTCPADPAGLPLILLLLMLGEWVVLPIQNGISRAFERQADMAALELAGRPDAFISAEERLARDNLSNLAPTPFNVWMFSSHPPAVERIEMAEKWKVQK
jgi:STE24 endopeptidase